MLRRLALTAVVSLAALSAAVPAATATAGPLPLPLPLLQLPVLQREDGGTHLTVVVSGSGDRAADGSYELECEPASGSHPVAQQACDRLGQLPGESTDPFTPVSRDAMCTQQYGGPATARVTGSWRGRSIDATFDRSNGCEIGRWNSLRPVLPNVR
ncbi:SSI family serine proteinase inhibitor [Streptomyces sp. NPDC048680]|uniref:SSI family serine proteinase inhibitor n=1 Tax=Streptomyces sp. NPDC048680 TaxID=3155492 RepID=UPI00341F4C4D